jgi:Mg-chelatase subunit ChlD
VNKDENLAKDLTAARLDDNKNFSSWIEKLKDYNTFKQFDTFGISATKRIKVSVADMEDKPVKNASVTLYAGNEEIFKAVTDNKGIAYLYYNWYYRLRSVAPDKIDKITVESKGKTIEEKVSGAEITVKADFEKTYLNELDIMFMIDTTGSMTDELDYLKYQTSSMLQKLPVQLDTKISVNFYRDEGDDYVVKANPFTSSIKEVTEYFSQTSASGGGDTPEAVDSALKNAIEEHSWRKDSIKLLFLVLDAEAHDDEEVKAQLYKSISMASQLGIRIVPVMASGANEVCEVMCRQMALVTGGQFVFLTDHSGIGSSHREPVTDVKYEIKPLITVLKEIINEYTC